MYRTYQDRHPKPRPEYRWWAKEPKWWRKLHKHRKRRQACRACRHQVMKGNEDVTWPLDKKPWIYYW